MMWMWEKEIDNSNERWSRGVNTHRQMQQYTVAVFHLGLASLGFPLAHLLHSPQPKYPKMRENGKFAPWNTLGVSKIADLLTFSRHDVEIMCENMRTRSVKWLHLHCYGLYAQSVAKPFSAISLRQLYLKTVRFDSVFDWTANRVR